MHNHPSGDPGPSHEDLAITWRLVRAGQVLGIPLLDHVIIGAGAALFVSR
jgi:DNA repair protein RadC